MEAILQKNIYLIIAFQKIINFHKKIFVVLNALIRIGRGDTKIGKTYVLGNPQNCPDY